MAGESPRVQGQQRGEFFALGEKLAATEEELRGEAQTAVAQRQVLEGSGGQVQRGQRGEAAVGGEEGGEAREVEEVERLVEEEAAVGEVQQRQCGQV